jgi:hypothetical protein
MTDSKTIIISPFAGGLGDNLCVSTLPELYAQQGYRVLIGRPVVEPAIRNPETKKLVWEMNPFVAGFTDEMGKTFNNREMHRWIWQQRETRTLVEAMEVLHGFPPTHRFPQIHYQPKPRPDVSETIFADPTAITQTITAGTFEQFIDHVCRARRYRKEDIVVLTSKHAGARGGDALARNKRYVVNDIFEYADIIASCRLFLTSESGGAILASAIRGDQPAPEVMSLFTTEGVNDRLYQFPNVRYCVASKPKGDYIVHIDKQLEDPTQLRMFGVGLRNRTKAQRHAVKNFVRGIFKSRSP